jgi:hypothetical protein
MNSRNLPAVTPLNAVAEIASALSIPPSPSNGKKPVDPSKVFTVEQQQAIVAIVEKWWKFRLESIETGKVIEMDDKLDYILARLGMTPPNSAQLQAWRQSNPRK